MDLEQYLPPSEQTDSAPRKSHFVAPASNMLPDDGVLQYVEIASVYDVQKAPDRSVLLFKPDTYGILQVLAANTKLFEVSLVELVGLPGSEYTADFGKRVWNLEKSAYNSLIADIRVASDAAAILKATEQTTFDREKAQYTRKDGTVKQFDDFVIGSELEATEEDNKWI